MTPAELRGQAWATEDPDSLSQGLDQAKNMVPDGCSASLDWAKDGVAIARIRMPNGEEAPILIGEGCHPSSPAQALTAACLRARAWLMENANG